MHDTPGPALVRWYLDEKEISQAELARRAGVSQPTVSRALAGEPKRHARGYAQLVSFIQKQPGVPAPLPTSVAAALEEVWDGTDAHEKALASLIVASAELWPKMKGGEGVGSHNWT